MHQQNDHKAPGKKPDLRDNPSTSLKNTDLQSPVQDPQNENSSDPRKVRSGPDIVKPGVGSQATGQTTRQ